MLFKDTPENRSLAAVIERDAKAATGLNLARRAFWHGCGVTLRFVGLGALLAGAGIGAQKAQEGYASIIGNQEIAERAAQTTAAMLRTERDEFHAMLGELLAKIAATKLQGTVTGEVSLRPATVGLDPNSTVRVAGDAPRPTQIQADAKPASGAPVIKTDVVQFDTVSYGKGDVTTGSRFGKSTEDKPSAQWCQYREPAPDGTLRLLTIGKDGQRVGLPTPSPFPSIDLQGAFASCAWASGASPPAHAPVERQASPPAPRIISARKG